MRLCQVEFLITFQQVRDLMPPPPVLRIHMLHLQSMLEDHCKGFSLKLTPRHVLGNGNACTKTRHNMLPVGHVISKVLVVVLVNIVFGVALIQSIQLFIDFNL